MTRGIYRQNHMAVPTAGQASYAGKLVSDVRLLIQRPLADAVAECETLQPLLDVMLGHGVTETVRQKLPLRGDMSFRVKFPDAFRRLIPVGIDWVTARHADSFLNRLTAGRHRLFRTAASRLIEDMIRHKRLLLETVGLRHGYLSAVVANPSGVYQDASTYLMASAWILRLCIGALCHDLNEDAPELTF